MRNAHVSLHRLARHAHACGIAASLMCLGWLPGALAQSSVNGEWSNVIAWPHIPVSGANLPDGRVLTWASNQHDGFPGGQPEYTFAATWDPQTSQFADVPHPNHDMFCAHQVMLADGRVFVSGGRNAENSPFTSVFDANTNSWIELEDMNRGRWYPTSLALPDGSVFTAVGSGGGQYPDLYTPGVGWNLLTNIDLNPAILNYQSDEWGERNWWPLLALMPDGRILHAGPTPQMHLIDTAGNGSIAPIGPSPSHDWYAKHGTTIMFDEGKLLTAGGWQDGVDGASTNQALIIDLLGPSPVVTPVAPMNYARKFHNGVMLPTGEVLIVGGNTSGLKFNDDGAVLAAEIWNPSTQTWRVVAAASEPRNYHSIALLLPDGRVLSAGGGLCGNGCSANHQDGQIYSPPYLFAGDGSPAARPTLTSSADRVDSGETFVVNGSIDIERFGIVKLSSTTHGVNTDVRYLDVPFSTAGDGVFTLTANANPNVLTPGYWMLFAINAAGVPSVAHTMRFNATGAPWIVSVANQVSSLAVPLTLTVVAGDYDGDAITFAASGLPIGLTIDANTGVISGSPTIAANFNVTVTVSDSFDGSASTTFSWLITEGGQFSIDRQVWTGIGGGNVSDLTSSPGYPDNPDFTETLYTFEAPLNDDNDYGQRIRGFVYPPLSGDYVFWIASDDEGQLWLSNNVDAANVAMVSHVPTWTDFREWDKFASQQSVPIALEAGRRYYIDALMKEGGGGDSLSVAWQLPGSNGPVVVDGQFLSPYAPPGSLALGQAASQSSTLAAANPAAKAVDGSTAGGANDVSHTQDDVEAWWEVDLGDVFDLELITIWNRTDCCADRLANFHVLVSPAPFVSQDLATTQAQAGVLDFTHSNIAGRQTDVAIGAAGRYVRVQLEEQNFLQLAEVQVFGQVLSTPFIDPIVPTPAVAGSSVSYTASTAGGFGLEYSWSFGDGSPDSAFDADPSVTHSYAAEGRYGVTLSVRDGAGNLFTSTFSQTIHRPLTANRPVASTPIVVDDSNDRVWNVNPDHGSVTVFDTVALSKIAEITVGDSPRALALVGTDAVWVTNKAGASISIIDATTLAVSDTLVLRAGSAPHGLVYDASSNRVHVALQETGEIVSFDSIARTEVARAAVGAKPRHLSLSGDGTRLLASRFVTPALPGENGAQPATTTPQGDDLGGEVLVLDSQSLAITATIVLRHSDRLDAEHSARGLPNYLGAATMSPDGSEAWVPSKQDNLLRGVLRDGLDLTHDSSVRAISSRINLTDLTAEYASRIDHDDASVANAAAYGPYGSYLFVALEGNREIAVVDVYQKEERMRFNVGRAVQGLAVSADGHELYAHNFMDRTLSVIDVRAIIETNVMDVTLLATLDTIASEALDPEILRGKQFFYDARDPRLTAERYMSCAACHNEGGDDGRVWDFTGFGEGVRNTIALNGHGVGHGNLHWTANFDEVQDFEGQIRSFAGGIGLMTDTQFNTGTRADPLGDPKAGVNADLDALAAYVSSLTGVGTSPQRDPNGNLSASALTGQVRFDELGCAGCHNGEPYTDSATGASRDVGTLTAASGAFAGLDTPTLRGLWASAPYLHDGSAPTVAAAIAAHDTVTLNPTDLASLAVFVLSVDDAQAGASGAPLNSRPRLDPIGDFSGGLGQSATIALTASDINNDPLTYAAVGLPGSLVLDPASGMISGLLVKVGSWPITVSVTDGALSDTLTFTLTIVAQPYYAEEFDTNVTWVNDPNASDGATTGHWEFADPEPTFSNGTMIQLDIPANGSSALITGAAAGASLGTNDVDNGVTSIASAGITLPPGANAALSFSAYLAHTTNAGTDDFLRVSVNGQVLLEEVGDGTLRGGAWTPFSTDISAFAGQTVTLLIEAADNGSGSLIEAGVDNVRIDVSFPNQAPVVTNPGGQDSVAGDTVALAISASDYNGDTLTFAAVGLPGGLTVHPVSGLISGVITATGQFAVQVSVDDGQGGITDINFNWTVATDADGDGIADGTDNCSARANENQSDTDGDGYGNACDADLNNDCIVNVLDLALMRIAFLSTGLVDADLNGDAVVNTQDLGIMRLLYFGAPGPSDLSTMCDP